MFIKSYQFFRQAFHAHLAKIAGVGYEGRAELDTYQERFTAYGKIVSETKGDNAKFTGFGMKLSEFCGSPMPCSLCWPQTFSQRR